jgi:hypothetical protein
MGSKEHALVEERVGRVVRGDDSSFEWPVFRWASFGWYDVRTCGIRAHHLVILHSWIQALPLPVLQNPP